MRPYNRPRERVLVRREMMRIGGQWIEIPPTFRPLV